MEDVVVALSGSKTCARRDDNLLTTRQKRAAAIFFTSIQLADRALKALNIAMRHERPLAKVMIGIEIWDALGDGNGSQNPTLQRNGI
jgi:hypothetical protein